MPGSETERALCELWAELLELDEVDAEADFFDVGGESITASRIAARIRERFAVPFTVRHVFENPTVAQLAQCVEEAGRQ